MAELSIAERRWPRPAERVLTLLADATPIAGLPPYLSAVTVLAPEGDPVAESSMRWPDGASAGVVSGGSKHRRRRC